MLFDELYRIYFGSPEGLKPLFQDGFFLLLAFGVGWYLSRKARDLLTSLQLDLRISIPWPGGRGETIPPVPIAPPSALEIQHEPAPESGPLPESVADRSPFSLTNWIVWLLHWTVVVAALLLLFSYHGHRTDAQHLWTILGRGWGLLAATVIMLAMTRPLAATGISLIMHPSVQGPLDHRFPVRQPDDPAFSLLAARGVVLSCYGLMLVPLALFAGEFLGWITVPAWFLAAWDLLLGLLRTVAAIVIGWTGLVVLRTLQKDRSTSRTGSELLVVLGTLLTCLVILSGPAGGVTGMFTGYVGLAVGLILAYMAWVSRADAQDVWASLTLRSYVGHELLIDRRLGRLKQVTWTTSTVIIDRRRYVYRNQQVLKGLLAIHPGDVGPTPATPASNSPPQATTATLLAPIRLDDSHGSNSERSV